jgi:hypothetical protein
MRRLPSSFPRTRPCARSSMMACAASNAAGSVFCTATRSAGTSRRYGGNSRVAADLRSRRAVSAKPVEDLVYLSVAQVSSIVSSEPVAS